MKTEPTEFYRKHRPAAFKAVVGQEDAVAVLSRFVQQASLPHALLFTGPSGCGKTTLARILKGKLECGDNDFTEINAADFRGIEMVREIRTRMMLSPIGGKCRIWLIDEAHKLSNDAQNALLKLLEDTPSHVYFMLATTDESKLIKTIITRCTEIKVRAMSTLALKALVKSVCVKESLTLSEEVEDKLVEYSMGSARMALVLLNKVATLDNEDERLEVIERSAANKEAIELARLLLNPRAAWVDVAKTIKAIEDEPETVRWIVLSYMKNVMLGGGKMAPRAYDVIQEFRDNFFDTKQAGLVQACYALVALKR